jgi:hypothetical protein
LTLHERLLHAARHHLRTAVLTTSIVGVLILGSAPTGAYAATKPAPVSTRPTTATAKPMTGSTGLWTLRSIDNMHVSRDFVCYQQDPSFIASIATAERSSHANFATVDTPYDAAANHHQCTNPPDPIAYEKVWVKALRDAGLHVWFRQTWFNWEGGYGAPKLTSSTTPAMQLGTSASVLDGSDTTSYLAKTYRFILDHPSLYANGDIFTPEAEPQNGGVRLSFGKCSGSCQFTDWPGLNRWLRDSMTVDAAAFRQLGLQVTVGYWGLPCSNYMFDGKTNNIEPATITQMGVFVTDCYFYDVPTMVAHLDVIHNTYNVNVIVGEWGDIWDTNPVATTREIGSAMSAVAGLPYIRGFNYWQGYGGSGGEGLIDKGTLRLNDSGLLMQSRF